MINHPFARYQNIIDDWDAFTKTLEQPLGRNVWLNPLKSISSELKQQLTATWQPTPLAAYTCQDNHLGSYWAYHAGLYHMQELVSMLPVLLLDPKPHERILDLCAAPGSKTVQMALAMQNQGTIIANDKNYARAKALRHHLERLGIVNVSTTTLDGGSFPTAAGLFDKVLVDAPCSGEGTSRKHSKTWETARHAHNIHQLQQRILKRAIALCKPGGLILYSTCTYAPEENEHVINTALQQHPELSLLPINIPNIRLSPGLTSWDDQIFSPELKKTARLWPHHNNTGGFYLALLQKSLAPIQDFPTKHYGDDKALALLKEHLGLFAFPDDLFSRYVSFCVAKRGVYILSADHQGVMQPKTDAAGLFVLKMSMQHPKLTTAGAKLWGHLATQQVIELDEQQLQQYLTREDQTLLPSQTPLCYKTGYVIIRHQGLGLGVGILLNGLTPDTYRLRSLYPASSP